MKLGKAEKNGSMDILEATRPSELGWSEKMTHLSFS